MRDSFVFYRSFGDALESLPAESYKAVMCALSKYAMDGEEPQLTGVERTIFVLIRPQIDANNRKFKNGKLGGRPPAGDKPDEGPEKEPDDNQGVTTEEPSDNQTGTKPEPNANENANENVNENVNENANDNAQERARAESPEPPKREAIGSAYPKALRETWNSIPEVPKVQEDDFSFQAGKMRFISPFITGIHSDDVLQAIKNLGKVLELSTQGKAWWKATPSIVAFFEKNIDRFLPRNFKIESYLLTTNAPRAGPDDDLYERLAREAEEENRGRGTA